MALPACTIIIFGATGDLTKRKLIPALYALHRQKRLSDNTTIITIGRREYVTGALIKEYAEFLTPQLRREKEWGAFTKRILYNRLDFERPEDYASLASVLAQVEQTNGTKNRLFYMATAPTAFPIIAQHLDKSKVAARSPAHCWHRLVFEKPFGIDLATAHHLNGRITKIFDERQLYRIDHYLGKSFVNEILVLRFSNLIFEKLWSREHIDHVRITVLEQEGIGTRGGYYDHAGALRDMIQSHLLQLVALTAMEAPRTLDANDMHKEKVRVLRDIKADIDSLVLGQYTAGQRLPDYTKEDGVRPDSSTETFASVQLEIKNHRWRGVPFLLKTGKALREAYAEVVISFKQSPCLLFCGPDGKLAANELTVRIQPKEGVLLRFNLADSAGDAIVKPQSMGFSHPSEFGINTPEAYEVLLSEAIQGDQTLFTSWDEVELCWSIIDRLRKAKSPILKYAAGSDGPKT